MASRNSNNVSSGVLSRVVCVTGAGGFIGTWLVKELLLRGYHVHGTVRNPESNAHLKELEGAAERLTLHKADIRDRENIRNAFRGCEGVFHVAAPVIDDKAVVPLAIDGTKNIIDAAADVGARRVVLTSSVGAIHMNPNRSPDTVVDETCWSDIDYCEKTKNYYSMSKTIEEMVAIVEAKARGIELAIVIPGITTGPMLQPRLNSGLMHILRYIVGEKTNLPNAVTGYVDVKDVAEAHILVYENPDASGRYFCVERVIHRADLVDMLDELLPEKNIKARIKNNIKEKVKPYKFSNQRLKNLGLEFTPLKKSLYETVKKFEERGFLSLPKDMDFQKLIRASL